ncbi:MAG: cytochrome c biogenesis protein CcdA [Planctomycetota bacterium]|nr:cytochrome c biogenesis protein CcdA [Planctomycetota bacterium]
MGRVPALVLAVILAWLSPAWLAPHGVQLASAAQPGADQPAVTLSAVASKRALTPGDQFAVAIVFDHAEHWHINTNAPKVPESWGDFQPIPTTIVPAVPTSVRVGPIQWPEAKEVLFDLTGSGFPEPFGVFGKRAIAFVPMLLAPETPLGTITLSFKVEYQACNEETNICQLPVVETLNVELNVVALGAGAGTGEAGGAPTDATLVETFSSFDTGVFARESFGIVRDASQDASFTVFGWNFTIGGAGAGGAALIVLLAVVGGFLLNLTPCVLPVIPLKIMGLSAAAGNPKRMLFLGFVMSAGVVAFWLAIGGAIAFIAGFKAINQLFQTPFFSLGVGVFIAVMGVGMLGMFAFQLPQWVYTFDPKRETATGSFSFGILTAVLSTPCTAPFMGSAAAWAAKQPPALTLATFAAIGAGMALPYLLLAAFPALVAKVPRSGAWNEAIKQFMGVLMLAVASFFVGVGIDPLIREPVDPPLRVHWWVIAFFVVSGSVWMVARVFALSKRPLPRAVFAAIGLLLASAAILTAIKVTDRGPIAWVGYTPARFEQARAENKVVVVDFTAEWCLNCKALEAAVLNQPEIAKLLNDPRVVPKKVDLTGNNPDGAAFLKAHNWVGIPLLAIYGPGIDKPVLMDTYTVASVREAIVRASGGTLAAR